MKTISILFCGALLALRCYGQTNVTGVAVDAKGKPIGGVRCRVSGFPQASGDVIYSGISDFVFTDKEGHFSIPVSDRDPMVDLQFDESEHDPFGHDSIAHAPVFLYKVKTGGSPLKVVMPEGKVLRGRIVERVKNELVPIPLTEVELNMPQQDVWYQNRIITNTNGEFRFRISEPPGEGQWQVYYAGKRFSVSYADITPDTVWVFEVSVTMRKSGQ
jgi:hypothetical protein